MTNRFTVPDNAVGKAQTPLARFVVHLQQIEPVELSRLSNHVEFEFRVRVRVSSNFLPLTSTKTVELPN